MNNYKSVVQVIYGYDVPCCPLFGYPQNVVVPGKLGQYSDYGTGYIAEESLFHSQQGQGFIYFRNFPDSVLCPPTFVLKQYRGIFDPAKINRGVKVSAV